MDSSLQDISLFLSQTLKIRKISKHVTVKQTFFSLKNLLQLRGEETQLAVPREYQSFDHKRLALLYKGAQVTRHL
jgi:hypothetical protein